MALIKPMSDKDWQAQRDLETLLEAACVRKDPKRLAAAKKAAKIRKKERENEEEELESLTGMKEEGE